MNPGVYIGKPFSWYGRGPDAYDCYGLARAALADFGILLPNYEYQENDHDGISTLIVAMSATPQWLPVEDPQPGDAVLLGHTPARFHHLGVMTEEGILHTTPQTGAILQSLAQVRRGVFRNVRAYRWAR